MRKQELLVIVYNPSLEKSITYCNLYSTQQFQQKNYKSCTKYASSNEECSQRKITQFVTGLPTGNPINTVHKIILKAKT